MKKNFLDIQIGDRVVVYDEYSHDYNEHVLVVTSIEYEDEWTTDTNPKGMHCYGTDLEEEEWGDDYITQVTESNFCRIMEEREHLWVCENCLAAIESHEGNQATLRHYVDGVESQCDWCKEVGFDTLYELI